MGRFVAKRRRGKMKTILALALAALAAAEPEADADAYYGYGYGLGGYYGGYRSYGLGYGHGLYYGKREAEAEPEADAYYGYGGYGLGGLYVATGLTVSDMATVSTTTARGRLSPTTVSTLLTTLLPLS